MAENMENQQYAFLKDWSTEELEQLLREDTCQDSTNQKMVDFALEVLLEREGYTKAERASMTQKAWDDFQKHYNIPEGRGKALYPMFSEENVPVHRNNFSYLRRISIAAALIVVLMLGAVQVLGLENIFTIVGQWTDSIFYFIKSGTHIDDSTVMPEYFSTNDGLMELWDSLKECDSYDVLLPTWLPERYEFVGIDKSAYKSGSQVYSALFESNNDRIVVQAKITEGPQNFLYEKDSVDLEKVTISNQDYYIMHNVDTIICSWATGKCECSVSGNLSKNEIHKIINSIG